MSVFSQEYVFAVINLQGVWYFILICFGFALLLIGIEFLIFHLAARSHMMNVAKSRRSSAKTPLTSAHLFLGGDKIDFNDK